MGEPQARGWGNPGSTGSEGTRPKTAPAPTRIKRVPERLRDTEISGNRRGHRTLLASAKTALKMLRKNPLRQRQFRELSLAMHMCWKTMILHLNVGENYVGEDSGGRNYVCRCNCFGELCLPIHK